MAKPKKCKCKPCRTCGLKHGCNVAVPHPGGWVRVIAEQRCPAPRERLTHVPSQIMLALRLSGMPEDRATVGEIAAWLRAALRGGGK